MKVEIENISDTYKLLNGFFKRTHKWKLSKMPNDFNGLLVQKIIRKIDSDSLVFNESHRDYNHSYFEYWKIVNGKIESTNSFYDDCWSYGEYNISIILEDCKKKYGIIGNTEIKGITYIVSNTHTRYEEIISTFKKGAVIYAGQLPSINNIAYEKEFDKEGFFSYNQNWDFSTDKKFFEAIKEITDSFKIKIFFDYFKDYTVYNDLRDYLFP